MSSIDLGIDGLVDIEKLGTGGYGMVYAATQPELDRCVAVKILGKPASNTERRRFETERKVMGKLSNQPNVVTVHDWGFTTYDQPYLIMELIPGGSLADQIDQRWRIPWREAVVYSIPIADALQAAHNLNPVVLHRDVKPENILLADDGARLTDFGIAKQRGATTLTSKNSPAPASILHSSPETFKKARDTRSDIYSLASTLHTSIAGKPPFCPTRDEEELAFLYRIINDPPPPLSRELAPEPLIELLQQSLAKDPDERPDNAAVFKAELVQILDSTNQGRSETQPRRAGRTTNPVTGPRQTPFRSRIGLTQATSPSSAKAKRRLGCTATAIMMLTAVAITQWLISQDDDPPVGQGTSTSTTPDGPTTSSTSTPNSPPIVTDCTSTSMSLTIGGLFDSKLSAEPRMIAAELAVEDINAAGGVFGCDVAFSETVADVSNLDLLADSTQKILDTDSLDAVLAVLNSETSLELINQITGSGAILMSPNNTSTAFTTEDTLDRYFRTAPSDKLQGRVLSDELVAADHTTAAVIYRDDAYGTSLADAFEENFEAGERRVVTSLSFPAGTETFEDLVTDLADPRPEAVIVIGDTPESAKILRAMHAQQIGPTSNVDVWAVDANAGLADELADESDIAEGLQQTVPSAGLDSQKGTDLSSRISDRLTDPSASLAFTPETYDALVILALAAVTAESDGPEAIAAQINDVTRDGTLCMAFAGCKELLTDGIEIDYNGIGGVYDFTNYGEPSRAGYRIYTYGISGPNKTLTRYAFGAVCTVCEANKFPEIEFSPGSAVIDPKLNATLNEVAGILNQPNVGQVEIQGYVSPEGSAEFNLQLSQERAEAVRTYLIEQGGVPEHKLVATGFGRPPDELPQERVVLFEEIVPVE